MSTTPDPQCSDRNCDLPASMAVRTTRPTRGDLRSTVFYDADVAPAAAQRLCRGHGLTLMTDMIRTLVPADLPPSTRPITEGSPS